MHHQSGPHVNHIGREFCHNQRIGLGGYFCSYPITSLLSYNSVSKKVAALLSPFTSLEHVSSVPMYQLGAAQTSLFSYSVHFIHLSLQIISLLGRLPQPRKFPPSNVRRKNFQNVSGVRRKYSRKRKFIIVDLQIK